MNARAKTAAIAAAAFAAGAAAGMTRNAVALRDAYASADSWEEFANEGGWSAFAENQRDDLIAVARAALEFLRAGPEGSVDAPREYVALRTALEKL